MIQKHSHLQLLLPSWLCKMTALLAGVSLFLMPLWVSASGISFTWESFIGPTSLRDVVLALLNAFIVIAIPIIVIAIIYAGFLYVTARGNTQQVQQATRALTYAIIGGILVIGAVAIAAVIGNVVGSFTP